MALYKSKVLNYAIQKVIKIGRGSALKASVAGNNTVSPSMQVAGISPRFPQNITELVSVQVAIPRDKDGMQRIVNA